MLVYHTIFIRTYDSAVFLLQFGIECIVVVPLFSPSDTQEERPWWNLLLLPVPCWLEVWLHSLLAAVSYQTPDLLLSIHCTKTLVSLSRRIKLKTLQMSFLEKLTTSNGLERSKITLSWIVRYVSYTYLFQLLLLLLLSLSFMETDVISFVCHVLRTYNYILYL